MAECKPSIGSAPEQRLAHAGLLSNVPFGDSIGFFYLFYV
jgi:hypothetical protein